MNITEQHREHIIVENNTAQKQLLDILENYSRQSASLIVNGALHGDIDFLQLRELGFNLIDTIQLPQGEITSIRNIPKGIKSFTCTNNLLDSLENLPSSLTHLNISDNVITSINVSNLDKLEFLNVSHNKLAQLENIPKNLVELLCDFNQLQQLDLEGNDKLKTLNISNNKITLIENLPEKVNLIFDNNPSIEFRNSDTSQIGGNNTPEQQDNTNYTEALNEYFRLKNEYETALHAKRKQIYGKEPNKKLAKRRINKYTPPCVKCKRNVGTVFSRKDNLYTAICGDTRNPCSLDIKIFPGLLLDFKSMLELNKEIFDEVSDIIIKQKLDTLFNYVSEDEAVKQFKKQIELYSESQNNYIELLDKYNEMYKNKDTLELIKKKENQIFEDIDKNKQLINEFKKTNNREFLVSAVDFQINNILPEIRNLRSLKYEIMEMNFDTVNNQLVKTLFQQPVSLSKLDYKSGEEQRVISFTV